MTACSSGIMTDAGECGGVASASYACMRSRVGESDERRVSEGRGGVGGESSRCLEELQSSDMLPSPVWLRYESLTTESPISLAAA